MPKIYYQPVPKIYYQPVPIIVDYFFTKNVIFDNDSLVILNHIYSKSFETSRFFEVYGTTIETEVKKYTINVTKDNWIICNKTCYKALTEIIRHEVTKTAYFLRLLINSIIYIPRPHEEELLKLLKLSIKIENYHEITGYWETDYQYISIRGIQNDSENGMFNNRLIMGFGPSASGKTFMTEQAIKLFMDSDPLFPNKFITFDGGIVREVSKIYRLIVDTTKKQKLNGIANLMGSGDDDLFVTGDIKKKFKQFLELPKYSGMISLYVPETLSKCILKQCDSIVQPFINITGDSKWIGLLIWQHKTGEECTKKFEFKCVGTTASGKYREKDEGKKYSSKAHSMSMRNGRYMLSKAPGYRLDIHNSGTPHRRSIMLDLSNPQLNHTHINQLLFYDCIADCSRYTEISKQINPNILIPHNRAEIMAHIVSINRHLLVLRSWLEQSTNYLSNYMNIKSAYDSIKTNINVTPDITNYYINLSNRSGANIDATYNILLFILKQLIIMIEIKKEYELVRKIIKLLVLNDKTNKYLSITRIHNLKINESQQKQLIELINNIINAVEYYKKNMIGGVQYYKFNNYISLS